MITLTFDDAVNADNWDLFQEKLFPSQNPITTDTPPSNGAPVPAQFGLPPGYRCAMVDSCPHHLTGKEIYNALIHNFHRHYDTNRAPFGLYFHTTWFKKPEFLAAFQKFLDEMGKRPDVWFVTNWQAVQWMRNPVPLGQVEQFEPWGCKKRVSQKFHILNYYQEVK
ncbi:hypothetical protein J437_LFUL010628 [Ladona fulva]|uniref:Uncharacterized protein n=1 Tax=Ladona fulva TaxID=123851 RepID=A0A8K0P1K1_LADFU|nr:hypothetical protein J437_LFUL010628 [Ladona fulva]